MIYVCPICKRTYDSPVALSAPPVCTNWKRHRPKNMEEK